MLYYDLKQEALSRKTIGNVVARENELVLLGRTLQRQFNNNLIIKGENGTGKTALIEGFAYRVAQNQIAGFGNFNFIKLDTLNFKNLIATNNQESLSHIISGFRSIPENTIVMLDDFQNILNVGKLPDLELIFSPFIENNDIRLVLAVSETGFQKLKDGHPNFLQHFEHMHLKENDVKETETILNYLSPAFENQYGIRIQVEAVKKLIDFSKKINTEKQMPLRAIHFLDEALAYAKISNANLLTAKEVQQVFADKTGVPSTTLDLSGTEFLRNLEESLNKNIIGQETAVRCISDVIKRSRMGLRNPNRPYGSFLFLGPSGVGKTELSKTLAKIVYGTERAFTRIDMSEFAEAHTVQRLLGAPPGYVGYEAGGQLTNAVKAQPYSLVLLDEIEKANAKIFDIFLQVFDDGRLTDGQGQTVNFTNTTLIATSNLGINEIVEAYQNKIDLNSSAFIEQQLMPILMRNFRTEFLNRFDAILVFNPLGNQDLFKIAMLEISKIEQRTAEHRIKFNIEPAILQKKVAELANHKFGARPIKRFIEQTCENLIAMKLMH